MIVVVGTLMYPFISISHVAENMPLIRRALSTIKPFMIELSKFSYFQLAKYCTLFAEPTTKSVGGELDSNAPVVAEPGMEAASSAASVPATVPSSAASASAPAAAAPSSSHMHLSELYASLLSQFPGFDDLSNKKHSAYHPHFTVGQWDTEQLAQTAQTSISNDWALANKNNASAASWLCDEIAIIARDGKDSPFVIKQVLKLGQKPVDDEAVAAAAAAAVKKTDSNVTTVAKPLVTENMRKQCKGGGK